jgi:hypothetical protein
MPDLREGCATGRHGEKTGPADALVLFGAMGDLAHKSRRRGIWNKYLLHRFRNFIRVGE